jgi:hypothetical protein
MTRWQEAVHKFLRRVGEYVRRGSEAAGEWLDEQAAITQRAQAIRRLRAEHQRLLLTIGGKVYTLHTRGKVRNRDVLEDCQRVDEILAHIERLRREIEEIKRRSVRAEVRLPEVKDEQPLVEAEAEEEAVAASPPSQGPAAPGSCLPSAQAEPGAAAPPQTCADEVMSVREPPQE